MAWYDTVRAWVCVRKCARARERKIACKKRVFFFPCYVYNMSGLLCAGGSGVYSLSLPWCLINRTSCGCCYKGHRVRKVGLQWNELIFYINYRCQNKLSSDHDQITRVGYSPSVQSDAWFLYGIFLNGSREVHLFNFVLFNNRRLSSTWSGRLVVKWNTAYCVQQTQACVGATWHQQCSKVAALSSSPTFKLPDLKVDH